MRGEGKLFDISGETLATDCRVLLESGKFDVNWGTNAVVKFFASGSGRTEKKFDSRFLNETTKNKSE